QPSVRGDVGVNELDLPASSQLGVEPLLVALVPRALPLLAAFRIVPARLHSETRFTVCTIPRATLRVDLLLVASVPRRLVARLRAVLRTRRGPRAGLKRRAAMRAGHGSHCPLEEAAWASVSTS